jgi:hypothetical protein
VNFVDIPRASELFESTSGKITKSGRSCWNPVLLFQRATSLSKDALSKSLKGASQKYRRGYSGCCRYCGPAPRRSEVPNESSTLSCKASRKKAMRADGCSLFQALASSLRPPWSAPSAMPSTFAAGEILQRGSGWSLVN